MQIIFDPIRLTIISCFLAYISVDHKKAAAAKNVLQNIKNFISIVCIIDSYVTVSEPRYLFQSITIIYNYSYLKRKNVSTP